MTQHEQEVATALFQTYERTLFNYCIRKHQYSDADSKEFVDETFCRLLKNITKIADRTPAEQRSWLYKTLENVILEHKRKYEMIDTDKSDEIENYSSPKDEINEIMEDETFNIIIDEVKTSFKDDEKMFVEKFIQGEFNYKEIAKSEGINYNTFKSQMLRLLPQIQKITLKVCKKHGIHIEKPPQNRSRKL